MTPSISILLPTRGRPEYLRRAVKSLVDLASAPERLELVLRYDDDDAYYAHGAVEKVAALIENHIVLVGPRWGYRRGHDYYNTLAEAAHGDWLFNWNDDTTMMTAGWDEKIRAAPTNVIQFIRRNILMHADTTFPFTPRTIYEVLGHLSLNCHVDTWLGFVARDADAALFRDDIVFHHERITDQTSTDRDQNYDTASFHSENMVTARFIDAEHIREFKRQERK